MLRAASDARNSAAAAESSAVIGAPERMDRAHLASHLFADAHRAFVGIGNHEVGERHRPPGRSRSLEFRTAHIPPQSPRGHLIDRALGRAVDRSAPTDHARSRAGVDDHATAALALELHHGLLATQVDAEDVDREAAAPTPPRVWSSISIPNRGVPIPALLNITSRRPVTRDRSLDRLRSTSASSVTLHSCRDRDPAFRLDEPSRLLGPVVTHVGAHHVGAFCGKEEGRRAGRLPNPRR